jgi:hypothetical protein
MGWGKTGFQRRASYFFKQTTRKIHALAAIPVPSPRAKQNK